MRRYLGASAMSRTRCKIAQLADLSHFASDAANGMAIAALVNRPVPGRIHAKAGY